MNSPDSTTIRHHLVFANPNRTSFDGQIVDTYVETAQRLGQDVVVRDLYAMGFDPVLRNEERPIEGDGQVAPDVATELEYLGTADILVLVYPIWFALPPAILKGYVDRVLGSNYSFRDVQQQSGHPALKGKPLLSFSTSGTSLAWLHQKGQVGSLREIFDAYLWQGLGMQQAEHIRIDSVVPGMKAEYAAEQLERVRSTVERTCAKLLSDRHSARTASVMQGTRD
ncbi:NAD(P)H-dependent oxidoreductase [Sphingomonas sp.]|jgi:NAD(P)H dehydrogenase (quinone)|uniref:NAD(P)H-dependent oxidoreductase n=1 Tax=Sphingomonas sp. TaxID=28214 RepID=UPI00262A2475|nr:NAD(P)H-dependent oxidoreductase [Sphingomonas sp.]MDF2494413.1 flavodoxin family protein [Sphingomonas sp.]